MPDIKWNDLKVNRFINRKTIRYPMGMHSLPVGAVVFLVVLVCILSTIPFSDNVNNATSGVILAFLFAISFGATVAFPVFSTVAFFVIFCLVNHSSDTQYPIFSVLAPFFCILIGLHRSMPLSWLAWVSTIYGGFIRPGSLIPELDLYSTVAWALIISIFIVFGYILSISWSRKTELREQEQMYRTQVADSVHSSIISQLTLCVMKSNLLLQEELTGRQLKLAKDCAVAAEAAIAEARDFIAPYKKNSGRTPEYRKRADQISFFKNLLKDYGFTVNSNYCRRSFELSSPLMQKAMGEIALNVLKYGSKSTPVVVDVRRGDAPDTVSITVVNSIAESSFLPRNLISSGSGLESLAAHAAADGGSLSWGMQTERWVTTLVAPVRSLQLP